MLTGRNLLMPTPRTAVIVSRAYELHDTGPGHPECPRRIAAVRRMLDDFPLRDAICWIEPRPCGLDDLLRVHQADYLKLAEREIAAGAVELSTGDTVVCPETWRIARLACGGVLAGIDAVCERRVGNAFCAVRPPGHHATPRRGMGFCVFSNIAVAARYAQHKYDVGKVLIVDWDVHHGNGTQDVFYEDDSVLFFSTHQYPWYPGTGPAAETGAGRGLGFTRNVPVPAGTTGREIIAAFTDRLLPLVETFRPELVLISAGFDSRRGDPLGGLLIEDEDFAELTKLMLEVANGSAEGRLVSVLEGGYSLRGLAAASEAHLTALTQGINDQPILPCR